MKSFEPAAGQQQAPAPQGQDASVRPTLSKRSKGLGLRRNSQQVGAVVAGGCGACHDAQRLRRDASKLDAPPPGSSRSRGLLNTLMSRPEDQDTNPFRDR
jgi:hypothetical protein